MLTNLKKMRICRTGKQCGRACIARRYNCNKTGGATGDINCCRGKRCGRACIARRYNCNKTPGPTPDEHPSNAEHTDDEEPTPDEHTSWHDEDLLHLKITFHNSEWTPKMHPDFDFDMGCSKLKRLVAIVDRIWFPANLRFGSGVKTKCHDEAVNPPNPQDGYLGIRPYKHPGTDNYIERGFNVKRTPTTHIDVYFVPKIGDGRTLGYSASRNGDLVIFLSATATNSKGIRKISEDELGITLAHELGHAVGLGHLEEEMNLMNAFDDKTGLQTRLTDWQIHLARERARLIIRTFATGRSRSGRSGRAPWPDFFVRRAYTSMSDIY